MHYFAENAKLLQMHTPDHLSHVAKILSWPRCLCSSKYSCYKTVGSLTFLQVISELAIDIILKDFIKKKSNSNLNRCQLHRNNQTARTHSFSRATNLCSFRCQGSYPWLANWRILIDFTWGSLCHHPPVGAVPRCGKYWLRFPIPTVHYHVGLVIVINKVNGNWFCCAIFARTYGNNKACSWTNCCPLVSHCFHFTMRFRDVTANYDGWFYLRFANWSQ